MQTMLGKACPNQQRNTPKDKRFTVDIRFIFHAKVTAFIVAWKRIMEPPRDPTLHRDQLLTTEIYIANEHC